MRTALCASTQKVNIPPCIGNKGILYGMVLLFATIQCSLLAVVLWALMRSLSGIDIGIYSGAICTFFLKLATNSSSFFSVCSGITPNFSKHADSIGTNLCTATHADERLNP